MKFFLQLISKLFFSGNEFLRSHNFSLIFTYLFSAKMFFYVKSPNWKISKKTSDFEKEFACFSLYSSFSKTNLFELRVTIYLFVFLRVNLEFHKIEISVSKISKVFNPVSILHLESRKIWSQNLFVLAPAHLLSVFHTCNQHIIDRVYSFHFKNHTREK